MKILVLTMLCTSMVFSHSFAQLIVTSSENGEVMRVSNEGDADIANSLTVKGLKNTSGTESHLVGVDQNGTLIRTDLSLLENGLIFYPVDNQFLVNSMEHNVISPDTMNAALDISPFVPDQATHIMVGYLIDYNMLPGSEGRNVNLYLLMDDYMPANQWNSGATTNKDLVSLLDGASYYQNQGGFVDYRGEYEQQDAGLNLVKLAAPDQTMAYRLRIVYNCADPDKTIDDIFSTIAIRLVLKGYYIPMSTLFQQP